MTDKEAKEFYNSEEWKHKRLAILRRDQYECQDCRKRLQEAKEKLQSVYSVNIIPNKYRSVYVAYYLYDYISSSHETDIDRVLQTLPFSEHEPMFSHPPKYKRPYRPWQNNKNS